MRKILLVPMLLLYGCASSVRKDTESLESVKHTFLSQVDHTVTYSLSEAESVIQGVRSVKGRVSLKPLIGGDNYADISESLGATIVTDGGEKISTGWPGWGSGMYVETSSRGRDLVSFYERKKLWNQAASQFDPLQEYDIELESLYYTNARNIPTQILRISKNGKTIIDGSICQVHKLRMKREKTDLCSSGDYPESFFLKQKKEFPNDGNLYLSCGSGILLSWKCSGCSQQYSTWTKKHGLE